MMVHRPHPITGDRPDHQFLYADPPDAILYDHCEDCERRGTSLAALVAGVDRDNLAKLWDRMVSVEHGHDHRYRTGAEGDACRLLYAVAVLLERAGLDPWRRLTELGSARLIN